jgi:basic amino acid/polyamine antiporter, APA family
LAKTVFVRDATGLVRDFRFRDLFFISSAIIVVLNGFVYTALFAPGYFPGAYLPLVFLIGSIPAWAMAYVYGKVSSGIPRSGGDYVWSTRILGPFFGSIQFMFLFFFAITSVGAPIAVSFSLALSQWAFGLGVSTGVHGFFTLASNLASPGYGYPLSLFILLLVTLVGFLGVRWIGRIFGFAMGFYYVVSAFFIVVLLATAASTIPSTFNHAMNVAGVNLTYSSVIQQGAKVGSSFNLNNTILAAIPEGFTTFLGFNFIVYVAGETRNTKASMTKALWLAVAITTVLLLVMCILYYNDFGSNFVNSISYLAVSNPSLMPVLPTSTLLLSFSSPITGTFLNWALAIGWCVGSIGWMITISRMVFAASFDRMFPARFSKVSDRFHSPYWAVGLIGVLAALYITIYWNIGVVAILLNTSVAYPIGLMMPLIATLLFPILRRDLYVRVFGSMQGAKAMIVASAIGVASFAFYIFAVTTPLVSGVYLGASLDIAWEAVLVLAIVGVGMYSWSRYNARRLNVDLKNIYSEIPPE